MNIIFMEGIFTTNTVICDGILDSQLGRNFHKTLG